MRNRTLSAFFCLIIMAAGVAGCASSKMARQRAAAGTWEYTVYGTPEGNVTGRITLQLENDALQGTIYSALLSQTVPLQNLSMEDEALRFSAEFMAEGQTLQTTAELNIAGDSMEGNLEVANYGAYRVTAKRAGS